MFIADQKKTVNHNAYNYLKQLPAWYYFTKQSNIRFHDLTTDKKPKHYIRSLLGINLKFIPTPFSTNSDLSETKDRLLRSMKLQAYFAGEKKRNLTK